MTSGATSLRLGLRGMSGAAEAGTVEAVRHAGEQIQNSRLDVPDPSTADALKAVRREAREGKGDVRGDPYHFT